MSPPLNDDDLWAISDAVNDICGYSPNRLFHTGNAQQLVDALEQKGLSIMGRHGSDKSAAREKLKAVQIATMPIGESGPPALCVLFDDGSIWIRTGQFVGDKWTYAWTEVELPR